MYRFSRSIYRELAPRVIEDPDDPTGCANKQRVLDACEGSLRRLATDRRYFARPTRTLFNEVRPYFLIQDQLRVYKVIEAYMGLAGEYLDSLPPEELDGLGHNRSARRIRARARRASASRCRAATTARRISTSRRRSSSPKRGSSPTA